MYESYFKLHKSPFQLSSDARFFINCDTFRKALSNLNKSFQFGDRFVAISGERGSGKTELMRQFAAHIRAITQQTEVACVTMSKLGNNAILELIASAFHIVNMGRCNNTLYNKIKMELLAYAREGRHFILLIDNAQYIKTSDIEILSQICALSNANRPIVQCFLFACGNLLDRLEYFQSCNLLDLHGSFTLPGIGKNEVQEYVENRLLQAGWQGNPQFTQEAFTMIHEQSHGLPWQINLICHQILMRACIDQVDIINTDFIAQFLESSDASELPLKLVVNQSMALSSSAHTGIAKEDLNTADYRFRYDKSVTPAAIHTVERPDQSDSEPTVNNNAPYQSKDFEGIAASYPLISENNDTRDMPLHDVASAIHEFYAVNDDSKISVNVNEDDANGVQYNTNDDNLYYDLDPEHYISEEELHSELLSDLSESEYDEQFQDLEDEIKDRYNDLSNNQYSASRRILKPPESSVTHHNDSADIETSELNSNTIKHQNASISVSKIAATASIITSLLITSIMIIIGEFRGTDSVRHSFISNYTSSSSDFSAASNSSNEVSRKNKKGLHVVGPFSNPNEITTLNSVANSSQRAQQRQQAAILNAPAQSNTN